MLLLACSESYTSSDALVSLFRELFARSFLQTRLIEGLRFRSSSAQSDVVGYALKDKLLPSPSNTLASVWPPVCIVNCILENTRII